MIHPLATQYLANIKRGEINDEMVSEAAFAFDARGAFYRYKELDAMQHPGMSPYNYRHQKLAFWDKKARLLRAWALPSCIHIDFARDVDIFFEGENGYDENRRGIVDSGFLPVCVDGERDLIPYIEVQRSTFLCYYGYLIAGRLFHVPITEQEAVSYTGLKISSKPEPERPEGWWFTDTLDIRVCNKLLDEVLRQTAKK